MSAFIRFTEVFESITDEISISEEHCNGTGCFDYLIDHCTIAVGKLARSIDVSGRRVILVGTPFGNLVVFDRFQPKFDGTDVISVNQSLTLSKEGWLKTGTQNMETLKNIFGDHNNNPDEYNIGFSVKHYINATQKLNHAA